MKGISIVVLVLGVVSLAFGILLVMQAGSAEKDITEELAVPAGTKVEEVDELYEGAKAKQQELFNAGAATKAPTDPSFIAYTSVTASRTGLGLTKTNLGLASFIRFAGITNLIIGIALILVGLGLYKRTAA